MKARDWLENVRALDLEILTSLGVQFGPGKNGEVVAIPYIANGETVAHKVRAPGDKPYWHGDAGGVSLWNQDILSDRTLHDQPLIITEGEYDALACVQAGFPATVSVPHGAQSGAKYVLQHADAIRKHPVVIIAADGDAEGQKMLRSVASALEGHQCRFIAYPEGCKDANDILAKRGPAALVEAINAAQPIYPDDPEGGLISGFSDAPPPPSGEIYKTGNPSVDAVACWHSGFPTIVTGTPSSGKSTWLTWALWQAGRRHRVRIGMSMLETPWPILRDHLSRLEKGHSFDELHRDQQEALMAKLDQDWRLLHQVGDKKAHDLGWLKEMMWVAAVRDQCRIIAFDPWNEIDHRTRHGEAMTDYLNDALAHIRMWAERYDVAVCIVAHPTKMQREAGQKPYPPNGYDISGSAAWFNKAAVGVTVHRTQDDFGEFTKVICWKSKFEQLYNFGKGQVDMLFQPSTMSYVARPRMQ